MTHLTFTPEGPQVTIELEPGFRWHQFATTDTKREPLRNLADAVDGFRNIYGSAPAVCLTGEAEMADLERHRSVWEGWGIAVQGRRYFKGRFHCGSMEVVK